jgi:ribulose 1,5-bisphosphate synthetase/thiazole synthase
MISRDGACISLWQQTSDIYKETNTPVYHYFDVAIAGGGITGINTALLLQKSGKKCIVFEAKNLCFGTTGGTTAHLNTLLDNPYTSII